MTDLTDRLRNLTPEQRRLLDKKMREKKIASGAPPSASNSAPATTPTTTPATVPRPSGAKLEFSLFFFSADGTEPGQKPYEMLLESARFADRNGFQAMWTPERHFQAFGGLYPNPSVLGAALAMITERLEIRAGSVVLPLHSPVRVAEEWALVDQLSGGRVGLSFATGWHAHDYVIAPANYQDRRELMFRHIPLVQRLWAGEEVEVPGVDGHPTAVRTLPRPVREKLPVWITASSPTTFKDAGRIGANVLSSMIGNSLEDIARLVREYRAARVDHGHDPRTGVVTLMLHTFLGHDLEATRETVREPMKRYLKQFVNQFRSLMDAEYLEEGSSGFEDLLELSFTRYFDSSSLLGTPEKCATLVADLAAVGVDEAACLVDFGPGLEETLESLQLLAQLRRDHGRTSETS